ncbi:unnamed protein product, partial [Phaeothamnion confervicola]
MSPPMWLGLDLSTQSLKVAVLPDAPGAQPAYFDSVVFARDLPQYNTDHGMHVGGTGSAKASLGDPAVVTSPVTMWLEALDMALTRLRGSATGASLVPRVRAVSVSGQQHGTVYWRRGAADALRRLSASPPRAATLAEALSGIFARRDCPIWADSSTVAECECLEMAFGGALPLAEATGSAAYPRFSGPQIAKFAAADPAAYAATERVSLVSSFVASVLAGALVPIDQSDGSGMNLMDIRSRDWNDVAVAAVDPTADAAVLRAKLGPLTESHKVIGTVSAYCCAKYGLPADCAVVAASGDNPCSNAGLGLTAEDGENVAVSLGTSDTVVGMTIAPRPQAEGHVMVSALDPAAYFAMLVYKNGALCRRGTGQGNRAGRRPAWEWARDQLAGGTWEGFGRLLDATPAGNGGRVGLFLHLPEITPQIERTGKFFMGPGGEALAALTPAEEARAVVEGRFLSMRARLQGMGISSPKRVLATGGGSSNPHICQILADVFGVPVYVGAVADAAVVGAALRAKHGYLCHARGKLVPFSEV